MSNNPARATPPALSPEEIAQIRAIEYARVYGYKPESALALEEIAQMHEDMLRLAAWGQWCWPDDDTEGERT